MKHFPFHSHPHTDAELAAFFIHYIFSLLLTCFSAAPLFSEASTGVKSKTLKLFLCSTIIFHKKKLYHSAKQKKTPRRAVLLVGAKITTAKSAMCLAVGV